MARMMGGGMIGSERARGSRRAAAAGAVNSGLGADSDKAKKKRLTKAAWKETRALMAARRGPLALGLVLMLISRAAGLVLPASSQYLIVDFIGKGRVDFLKLIAFVFFNATAPTEISTLSLHDALPIAAQRAITDMR